jgi:hypothetical protein
MSLRGTIRRPDKGPLGTVDEVKHHLSEAFPGVQFSYVAEEPCGLAEVRKNMSLLLRLWRLVLSERTRYPHHYGLFEGTGAVEFYFEPEEPVRWIRSTSYGRTTGLHDNFDRLHMTTGWVVVYPRF